MTNKVADYRAKRTKKVKVPSGFEFTIKSLSIAELTRMQGESKGDPLDAIQHAPAKFLLSVLKECVVDPPIVEEGKGNENALGLDDLDFKDASFLINEIGGLSVIERLTHKENSSP